MSVGCSGSSPQLGCDLMGGVHTCLGSSDESTQKYHADCLQPVLMLFSLPCNHAKTAVCQSLPLSMSETGKYDQDSHKCVCGDP